MLRGKKTYIVGAAMILYGVVLIISGNPEQGTRSILEGFAFITARQAIAKVGSGE